MWGRDWTCNLLFIYSFTMRFAALQYMQQLVQYPRTTPFPDDDEYIRCFTVMRKCTVALVPPKQLTRSDTCSYDHAFSAITEYTNSMSLNIFLSWLKLFKYLMFVPFMRVLVSALGNSVAQVFSIFWFPALAHCCAVPCATSLPLLSRA